VSESRDADSVAARLRTLRGSLGLSQEQLARRLGVSFATVNRWEAGRTQLSAKASRAITELEAELASTPSGGELLAQLPLAQTSFVGRERELAELAKLLGQSRLVTLIGPGGAGKTRLAIEVLSRSSPDADVVFVPLESVRLPRTLTSALASRLRVHDQRDVPLIESVRAALALSPRVLVLDGAESLREEVASLVSQLLAVVPALRVVVTSRVVLGVPGEVCWTVPPLDCPSVAAGASDIASSDAVRLFVARASDRLPGFQAGDVAPHAIAELCRRLDGLPLAIELIASWVGTLSIKEILQQRAVLLDSEPATAGGPGGRKLGDVLRVSYDLLEPRTQRLLPMLSVFAGSFSLADARSIVDADLPTAAGAARALVDSSWLLVDRGGEENRFSMLDTIRSFAAAELEKTAEAPPVRQRHARHFANLAVASEQGLTGPDAAGWTARIEAAVPDLHLALMWAYENGDVDLGLDASAALWRWWLLSGRLALGRNWLARFLAVADRRQDERTGRALSAAAVLAVENGDYQEAVRSAELALRIFEPLGLTERMAMTATVLASAHRYLGDNAAARRSFQAAMDLRTTLGDRRGVAAAINNMALLEIDDGNLERAQQLFEQALIIKRQLGERRSIAIGLANLADVLIRTGQWEAAESVLTEAAELAGGQLQVVGTIRCNQGHLAAHRQRWAEAEDHFQAAIAASQAGGHPHDAVEAMIGLARVHESTGSRAEARRQLRDAQALATEIGNAQRVAAVQAALAELDSAQTGQLPANLTSRQAQVLRLLAAGMSNRQIAEQLYLSPATVERHLATIYGKLGLGGRVDAARFAIENGLGDVARDVTAS
jgi:predicted ATPase/DNA-binding CsgD family transcriptional regulator/DNA-binding XRE family transcriptional regulator